MTISAQPPSLFPSRRTPSTEDPLGRRHPHARRGRTPRIEPVSACDERPTADLGTGHSATADAFTRLDHRTQSRSVAPADAPPGRYLSAEDGDEVRLVALDEAIMRLGRGLSADVRIDHPEVSRRHAIIAQRGDGIRVLDDRSANGTHLNGRPVTIGYLNDGDVLRLGPVVLRFVEIAPVVRAQPLRRLSLTAIGRCL